MYNVLPCPVLMACLSSAVTQDMKGQPWAIRQHTDLRIATTMHEYIQVCLPFIPRLQGFHSLYVHSMPLLVTKYVCRQFPPVWSDRETLVQSVWHARIHSLLVHGRGPRLSIHWCTHVGGNIVNCVNCLQAFKIHYMQLCVCARSIKLVLSTIACTHTMCTV